MSTTAALVRFSWLNVFEPVAQKLSGGEEGALKYSVCCLIPKTDTKSIAVIEKAVQHAIEKGIAKKKINEAQAKSTKFRKLLRDGDEYYAENPKPENEIFKGMVFFNTSNKDQPGIVDEKAQPLIDKNRLYSGCWGRVDCGLYVYNFSGNIGVGAGLNNLMLVKEDTRLDGRTSAESAFGEFAATTDNSDLQ